MVSKVLKYNNIKFISVYETVGPVDTTEGRYGGNQSYGYFAELAEAIKCARGKGVMGTEGEVKTRAAISVNDIVYLIEEIEVNTSLDSLRRKKALAKLTAEEKKILGL